MKTSSRGNNEDDNDDNWGIPFDDDLLVDGVISSWDDEIVSLDEDEDEPYFDVVPKCNHGVFLDDFCVKCNC